MANLDRHWWGLPGPDRFLGRVADGALGAPEGIIGLSLPRIAPEGILEALALRLEQVSSLQPVVVDASRGLGARQPLRVLANLAGVDTAGIRQTAEFLDAPSLADTVFLIHDIKPEDWLAWSLFFRSFRLERRSLARMSAPSLVVVPPSGLPPEDVKGTLGGPILRWMGAVTRLDTRMQVDRLGARMSDTLLARTAAETTIELAAWDPDMVRELVRLPYEMQLNPIKQLSPMADALTVQAASWENALVDLWDGVPHVHTLALIAACDHEALRARLWSARVRVVFPFIEMVRHAVISKYEPFLRQHLPYGKPNPYGREPMVFTEPHRLEFYEVRQFLRGLIPQHESLILNECYQLRRAMAHADPGYEQSILNLSELWETYSHSFPSNCAGWDWPRCGQRLVMMVGPSGAGKSTYAQANYSPDEIVSSDSVRERITGRLEFGGDQNLVFEQVRQEAVLRLSSGHRTVIDATHVKTTDRLVNARLVPLDIQVEYVVIDRSLEEKRRDGGWRLERGVIDIHAAQFALTLPDVMKRDGLPNVIVTLPDLDGRNIATDAAAENSMQHRDGRRPAA